MMASLIWAQGTEDFEGSYNNLTGSYDDGSFVGNGDITWTYGHSRDEGDYPIDDKGLMLRRASDSYLEATFPDGIGTFSFQYRKAFTGSSARQLEVYVNGVVKDTSPTYGTSSLAEATIYTMTVNINQTGPVTVKIKNVGSTTGNRQTTIDNISWTGYGGSLDPDPEPTNHPTSFAAADGDDPFTEIKLSWVDATGDVVPDGYLIKASSVGYGSITDPVDGTPESNGSYVRNVAAGAQTYTFTSFNGDTTYYFKIYPYTNSGNDIDYKTDGAIQSTSHKTKAGPAIEEVLFPQYIQGENGTNNERIAWAGRLTLKNLEPNSTYRYYGLFVVSSTLATSSGAGIGVLVSDDGTFSREPTPNLKDVGKYGEFTTDANGSYTGWFMGEPSGNATYFTPETEVYYRITLNDGDDGESAALRLTSQSSIKVIRFGTETSMAQGTLLWGETDAPPKHFMFVYDNEAGTGRPINGNVIESDGIDLSGVNQIPAFYKTNIDGINGAWGLIIPNCVNPAGGPGFDGIKRLEIRDFETGEIYSWCTSPDGIWNGVTTVRQKGGLDNPIKIGCEDSGTVPVELSSFTATISANNFVQLNWVTQTETGVMGYYIYRAMEDNLASAILVSPMIAATNTSHAQSYAFVDSEIYEPGMYYYWLQNSDFDGSSNFHGPISIQFNTGGHDGSAPEIPLTTQLMAAFPNPFNPSTRIPYQLAKAGNVDIRIYNNRGQLVRSYPMGMKDAGYHSVTWDGLAEDGSECGTGIYYIRMQTGDKSYGSKAVMIK